MEQNNYPQTDNHTQDPSISTMLAPSALPYQLPEFAAFKTELYLPAFREAMRRHQEEIQVITQQPTPTWENTVEAMEAAGKELERVAAVFFNLQGTDSSPELEAIAEEIVPELSAHDDAIYQNQELFERIQAVDVPEDEESQRLHKHLVRAFSRRGAALNEQGRKELSQINQKLSSLSETFGRNLLADTKQLAVHFDDPEELAGLGESGIQAAQAAAKDRDLDGYVLPIELPSVQSAQASLEHAASRRRLYEQAGRRGVNTNAEVLIDMVRLRARRAELLGYQHHADYVIEQETAPDATAVRRLLEDLAPAAAANATAEYKLAAEAAAIAAKGNADQDSDVEAADWPYWEEQVRRRDFDLDSAKLASYFPLDQVLRDGVFYAAKRLYGIEVVARDDLQGYAEGVQVWEVKDEDGSGIGLLLTDYFARPSKRGGAWMSSFVDQSELLGTKPVVINVMGINRPADGSQPLLSLDQVTTIFHEFGHGLHGLLSKVRYPSFSGTSVPRDYVEFPSQINENWAFEPSIVRNYARHVDTGEVIPTELLEAIERSRTFGQGFATSEYLGAAIIDLAWHMLSSDEAQKISADADSIAEFEARALANYGLDVAHLAPRYRSTYFNHIFAGGYSAGYYSYLWAEVLDADGFEWFKEVGATGEAPAEKDMRAAGQKFRDLVLSRGAASDYTEAFKTLRGRDKDVNALLLRRGLGGTAV